MANGEYLITFYECPLLFESLQLRDIRNRGKDRRGRTGKKK
jgi:hypothetical protein